MSATRSEVRVVDPNLWPEIVLLLIALMMGVLVVTLLRRNRMARKRVLGSARGEFTVPTDFNDPLPKEIEEEFYKR